MEFQTEDDAKSYSINITSKRLQPDDAQSKIEEYKSYRDSAIDDENREYWENELTV